MLYRQHNLLPRLEISNIVVSFCLTQIRLLDGWVKTERTNSHRTQLAVITRIWENVSWCKKKGFMLTFQLAMGVGDCLFLKAEDYYFFILKSPHPNQHANDIFNSILFY